MARLRANLQFAHLAAHMGDDLSDIEPAAEESSTLNSTPEVTTGAPDE